VLNFLLSESGLDSAVGRAQAGRDAQRWQGANPSAAPGQRTDSQCRQSGAAELDRVCGDIIQEVNPIVATDD
jgi:hypothetical protein